MPKKIPVDDLLDAQSRLSAIQVLWKLPIRDFVILSLSQFCVNVAIIYVLHQS